MISTTKLCRCWSLVWLTAISLCLCSCRGIPGVVPLGKERPTLTKESLEKAGTSKAPVVSAKNRPRAKTGTNGSAATAAITDQAKSAAKRTEVQQVAWQEPGAAPKAAPRAGAGQLYPSIPAPPPSWSHSAQLHGPDCPCCSPGSGGPFRFGSYIDGNGGGGIDGFTMQCAPDGLACPWPADEYICDGGDHNLDANVRKDWTVVGVDQEDTVAHYDTLDGKTEITESNKVCIYAPRFAAVRKVVAPVLHEGHERMADMAKADKLNLHEEKLLATTAVQPEQILADVMIDQAQSFRERNAGVALNALDQPLLARQGFLPFEDLQLIHRGVFEAGEKARLAERTQAAVVWQVAQAVQVVIDGKMAVEGKSLSAPEETVVYELEGKPRLRICKIADKSDARPGEIVNFTLRFDNVGEQTIGNVTIVDNLTTRLEYVEGSQSCSLKADFATELNEGESLVLRWAVIEPMKVRDGGIIRFQCRVR
jgi:uncharacterized repeat protein (TIGR01451 family)